MAVSGTPAGGARPEEARELLLVLREPGCRKNDRLRVMLEGHLFSHCSRRLARGDLGRFYCLHSICCETSRMVSA